MNGGQRRASEFDGVVVGAGPNGLAAAIELARADRHVLVAEASDTVGGGARTAELTLPGFRHDVCSAAHPLAAASPFFRSLPLERHGLEWVHAPAPLAHPLDDGPAVLLLRSLDETATALGDDAGDYRRLLSPFVERWDALLGDVLAPPHPPRHPLLLARFGLHAIRSGSALAGRFAEARTRALLAGLCAHAIVPLERAATAAFGLVLAAAAHAAGWPLARGGSQAIADALAGHLLELGGHIATGRRIERLDELPRADDVVLDLTPRQVLHVAGARLPARYRRQLARYRYGPGVFKLDWALSQPIPWRDGHCALAYTVHLGGSFEEIAAAERAPWEGRLAERPFVLLTQPSLFDASRAPAGRHTAWAYCHVPHGYSADATANIEAQVERFAPGFRDCILARSARGPVELERENPNLVGGDIAGGASDLRQLLLRPVPKLDPYATPLRGLYVCSASTPPGGGVHGMCGYNAARSVLRRPVHRRAR